MLEIECGYCGKKVYKGFFEGLETNLELIGEVKGQGDEVLFKGWLNPHTCKI